jgi:hypothetical protein
MIAQSVALILDFGVLAWMTAQSKLLLTMSTNAFGRSQLEPQSHAALLAEPPVTPT